MKPSSKYGMPTPKSREEFEHNVFLTKGKRLRVYTLHNSKKSSNS